MKLKLSLLFVTLLLMAVSLVGWYLRQPVSSLPPAVRTINGITLVDPQAPQYQAFLFCDEQRPVVVYLLQLPAGVKRLGGSDARAQLQQEIETRMTHLARLNGEYALFAGEAAEEKRPIPISPDEFELLFDIRNGALNNQPPHDALGEIWASHVAPHWQSSSPEAAAVD
ncbi:hypothetical protein [Blastopirellula marina]|uniref:Adenylosuccinate lyase n=1 Tax=Blastopirellula marina DSM 3645 TaxID=314230 RepID=A3ZYQ9_9BACT|nr:hypothetical protein [Blastopirellula marina]EAQ78270.1 adenylosuccinate lyase [Blastopirellula marina DSM 3645]